ncbi:hypothetical protein [Priestia abyssalis]|uniref:hypothetical protein n=1 Tax=Priestia abyssalis TaxID=1221450 RepID=UPI0009948E59|nr:hypothetical protein [Priestia abyssalis]
MAVELVKKSRSQNGKSWCVMFEHPFRKAADGKKGQPVRIGLNTKDEEEAEKLRKQLQDLVADENFWTPKAKMKAKTLFDERVVAAVYGQWQEPSFEGVRDSCLPFQSEEGYANIQLIGDRGTGKTLLLRQLLGLNEEAEPFPAAGYSDSVRYEAEWLLADQECYEAVVTFVPFMKIKAYVEEALLQAAMAYALESSEQKMIDALMGKEGMLRSLIGFLPSSVSNLYGWFPASYEKVHLRRWAPYVKALQSEASRVRQAILSKPDAAAEPQSFKETWERDARCMQLAEALVEEVERNFGALEEGNIMYHEDDWPLCWRFKTKDRAYFLQVLYQLFGDDPAFDGKQLSSLVEGMRLKGPFRPLSHEQGFPKLMITERRVTGGHLSAWQIEKITAADAAVLVEKGGALTPSSLWHEMVITGQTEKLSIVFTDVDDISGNRLRTYEERCEHLLRSLNERIETIGDTLGEQAARTLTRVCRQNGLHIIGRSTDLQTVQSLQRLTHALEKSTIPKGESRVHPIYVSIAVSLAIYEGAKRFCGQIQKREQIAAAFASCMGEALYRFFIKDPSGWSLSEASYAEKDRTIERICFFLHQDLLAYAQEELCPAIEKEDGQKNWQETLAKLVPAEQEAFIREPFLRDLYGIVKGCIERAGGVMIS